MTDTLSLPEARRLALASQGFGPKAAKPGVADVRRLASRVHAFQIDSVNVLARAHYVPAFARLGPYSVDALDALAYRRRELFEYWGHAACLMPVALYPLLRYRMHKHAPRTEEYMGSKRGEYMARVYAEVSERGPIAASDLSNPGKRRGSWWGWGGTGNGKATLEHLFEAGLLAIAGRRGFERLYDIRERVIPRAALEATVPPREEAMKQLICLAAQACGVGTFGDITGYFYIAWWDRLLPGPLWELRVGAAERRCNSRARGRSICTVRVERKDQSMPPRARIPASMHARALVTPFDSLVWDRSRVERLFGMKYVLEIYVPPPKRRYGYYVFPFVLGDTPVARFDLKADRERRVLMVQSAFLERGQKRREVVLDLADEIRQMQAWLRLDAIEVADRGDLAGALRRSVRARRA